MAIQSNTLLTYNPKTNHNPKAQHNKNALQAIKHITANGTKAVTAGQLVAYLQTVVNNPQYVNYGFKNNALIKANAKMPVYTISAKQLAPQQLQLL